MKVIDSHLHFGWLNNNLYDPAKVASALRGKIELGVISSLSGGTVSQGCGNLETSRFLKNHKNFCGLIWINPYDPNWKNDAKKYLNRNFVGIKLHPGLNNFRITYKFLSPVFQFAKKHLPTIAIHTDEKWLRGAGSLEPIIKKFPAVKLILYHMHPPKEAIRLGKKYKNVYLETSGSKISLADIKKAVKYCGADKVIFGSDFPVGFKGFPTISEKPANKDYKRLLGDLGKSFGKGELEKILYQTSKYIFVI